VPSTRPGRARRRRRGLPQPLEPLGGTEERCIARTRRRLPPVAADPLRLRRRSAATKLPRATLSRSVSLRLRLSLPSELSDAL
jgi:hypothetical protein